MWESAPTEPSRRHAGRHERSHAVHHRIHVWRPSGMAPGRSRTREELAGGAELTARAVGAELKESGVDRAKVGTTEKQIDTCVMPLLT